jgi:hypothetical protein
LAAQFGRNLAAQFGRAVCPQFARSLPAVWPHIFLGIAVLAHHEEQKAMHAGQKPNAKSFICQEFRR